MAWQCKTREEAQAKANKNGYWAFYYDEKLGKTVQVNAEGREEKEQGHVEAWRARRQWD